jgi:hypothetical protein
MLLLLLCCYVCCCCYCCCFCCCFCFCSAATSAAATSAAASAAFRLTVSFLETLNHIYIRNCLFVCFNRILCSKLYAFVY